MQDLKDDIKAIRTHMSEVRVDIARNTVSLEHHVKRTDLAEQRIIRVENWLLGLLSTLIISVVGLVIKSLL
jgi:hypothetical protein